MNRLVLIGNGFDLAHGLETGYKHFFEWYLNQWGYRLLHGLEKEVSDGLLSFKLNDNLDAYNWTSAYHGCYYKRVNPQIPWDNNEAFTMAFRDRNLCNYSFKSPLLKRIWNQLLAGWVDIENEYFSLLKEEIESLNKDFISTSCKELNNHLDIIRKNLIDYLKLEEEKQVPIFSEIKDKIYRPIKKNEIAVANNKYSGDRLREEMVPSRIMLLNFNYTKTPELYIQDYNNVAINYIHGKLDSPSSVIFGYGDELSDSYKSLNERNDNEFLRHIKSIRYLESSNYRMLLEFIESGPFQVCIMGHSCGNSDRTLLNTLFEHHFCVSVKPYYYINEKGEDNYLDLVQNISRNFVDKKLMRDRVVCKPYCEPLTKNKE